jgi:PKD repeat protein
MFRSQRENNSLFRITTILILIFAVYSVCFGQESVEYYPGMITIKVIEEIGEISRQTGAVTFRDASLNELSSRFSIDEISKRFKYNQAILDRQSDCPDLSRIYKLKFPENINVHTVVQAFNENTNIEYAEPISIMQEFDVPNDEYYSIESHLPQIQASEAWNIHHGEDGGDVLIGICDSAVEWNHPDLLNNVYQNLGEDADGDGHVLEFVDSLWVFDPGDVNGVDDDGNGYVDDFIGWNYYTDDGSMENDPNGSYYNIHGTHVAGIAAGVTNNDIGIASVSWNVKFLPTKHSKNIFEWPMGYLYDVWDGVIYLAEMGCDIINTSWGGGSYSNAVFEVITYARSLGSIMVAAAGNSDNNLSLTFPACYPGVISVAAVTQIDERALYSNYGIGVDICAPGGYGHPSGLNIYSTIPIATYLFGAGTSMACPMVAGLLGLVKSYHPDWSNEQLVCQVLGTTDDIDQLNPGYTNMLGSGRINAYRALAETNVTVPQELRLELVEFLPINDDNGNQILEPGETASLGMVLRNYAHFVGSDNVSFSLSTTDPDVTVVDGTYSGSIAADANNITLEDIFTIQIDSDAESHSVTFTIEIDADIDITYGSEITFDAYINPSGIFIWDGDIDAGTLHYSGTFIHNYLSEHGISSIHTLDLPFSLVGFEAVFLSFGNSGTFGWEDTPFTNVEAQIVQDYLESGGYLYMEGGSSLTYYQSDNLGLHDLFGLQILGWGTEGMYNVNGQENTLTEGISFQNNSQYPRDRISVYLPNNNGLAAFVVPDYGTVAIQNEGEYGQKTFYSSHVLAGFDDEVCSNRRDILMARLLQFMEIPNLEANFEMELPQGYSPHVPITASFTDYSVATTPINSWAWDFDNDGTIDSYEENPSWTFTEPGYQSTRLEISNGITSSTYLAEDYLYFYNGETAVLFGPFLDWNCSATVPSTPSLNLTDTFTLETWIKPTAWGFWDEVTNRILDKGSFCMAPELESEDVFEEYLSIWTTHADGIRTSYTPNHSIHLNEWQHVAITYDGQNELKVYIDGIQQELYQEYPLQGPLLDNTNDDLIIGNCSPPNDPSCFQGSIDDVRVWDIVRSTAEINNNKDHCLEGNEEGLMGYWKMNEAIGDTIYDLTQNQNTGTLYATYWTEGAITPTTSIEDENFTITSPHTTQLHNNYPNPFNPTTTISFDLSIESTEKTELNIYNLKGQKVKQLVNEQLPIGRHSVVWNGRDNSGKITASGIYFYDLKVGNYQQTKKMILMK